MVRGIDTLRDWFRGYDGNTYMHYYNYFVFTCDEKHAYATGLISYDDTPEAKRVVQEHFPDIPIKETYKVKEWKQ